MDKQPMIDFLLEFLAINTSNPPGTQSDAVQFLRRFFHKHQISCNIDWVGKIPSLFARFQFPNPGKSIYWIGHWDVVPAGPLKAWTVTPPFTPRIVDGKIYGRGACDMKSGVVAAMFALLDIIHRKDLGGNITLAILGDEENGGVNGASILLPAYHKKTAIDYALVGEPTGFQLRTARRGVCWGKLTLHGIQAHAARPQEGDNPISKMGRVICALDSIRFPDSTGDVSGGTTLSITSAHSGDKDNVIPQSAELGFDIRTAASISFELLQEIIHNSLQNEGFVSNKDYELNLTWLADPYHTTDVSYIEKCRAVMLEVLGQNTENSLSGGTSDGRFLAHQGVPVVEIGLENTSLHKVNEFCTIGSLEILRKLYRAYFIKMCTMQ